MNKHADIILGCVVYKCFLRPDKVIDIWDAAKLFFERQGVNVTILLFLDYRAQVQALASHMIDIAWNTPLAYVQTKKLLGKNCRIMAMRDSDLSNRAVFIVPTTSSLKNLEDLRMQGGTIALGSSDSLYANIIPRYFLQQKHVAVTDRTGGRNTLVATVFERDLGKHGDTGLSELDVVYAVWQGMADVGVLAEASLNTYLECGILKRSDVKVLWKTPSFSHCNLTSRADIDQEKISRFRDALFSMNYTRATDRFIMDLEGLRRWIPGDKARYQLVEKAVDAIYPSF